MSRDTHSGMPFNYLSSMFKCLPQLFHGVSPHPGVGMVDAQDQGTAGVGEELRERRKGGRGGREEDVLRYYLYVGMCFAGLILNSYPAPQILHRGLIIQPWRKTFSTAVR